LKPERSTGPRRPGFPLRRRRRRIAGVSRLAAVVADLQEQDAAAQTQLSRLKTMRGQLPIMKP
jgi:hypothetical protein